MLHQRDTLATWTKSSYSAVNGDCVEVRAPVSAAVSVRDSKNPAGPVIDFRPESWDVFVGEIRESAGHTD